MSLLGIDVGTSGCKAVAFTLDGRPLATAYEEYDIERPRPGWAELDARAVWAKVKRCIAIVAVASRSDPITALAVSSLGEAAVPVGAGVEALGGSILSFDARGEEYLPGLRAGLGDDRCFEITGNTLGNHFGLTKLMWLRHHDPGLYDRTQSFLPWSSFVAHMLGAEPVVDFSLANRLLLFDLDRRQWSREIVTLADLDAAKLPTTAPAGVRLGRVAPRVAEETGLPAGVAIILGAHDQCANAVGCGVVEPGRALWGMGTFICAVPVYRERPGAAPMVALGLNVEHHAAPGRYVTFIYNQGGSLVKWYRDTFAAADRDAARRSGADVYANLLAEAPPGPSGLLVLPHFTATGPPEFISGSSGAIVGLRLETSRGEVLKGILEGTTMYLRQSIEALPRAGITATEFRVAGGGSRSDLWVQTCADIVGRPFLRPRVTEAGALGAAILAGVGSGEFADCEQGIAAMVRTERRFEPDPRRYRQYEPWFERYRELWPLLRPVTTGLPAR